MDEDEEFKKQIRIMENKINSIKTGIAAIKLANPKKKRKDINHTHSITNHSKDNNTFNKNYTPFQTTPNVIYRRYHYTMKNTLDSDVPVNVKGISITRNKKEKDIISNFVLHNKGAVPLRKAILDKERYRSFDNVANKNGMMLHYKPLQTSDNSFQQRKFKRTIRNHSYNNNNNSYNSNGDCNDKHNVTYTNKMNDYLGKGSCLNTSTQERSSTLQCNGKGRSHKKLYNELKCIMKENIWGGIEDNESEESVERNEEMIINEYKRVVKENKEKDMLISKVFELYEENTGEVLNGDVDVKDVLFDWIKKMSSFNYGNFIDDKYKNYCENIMHKYNLSNFDELKEFVNHALLMVNKKSSFLEGIKKLLLKDPNVSNYDEYI